MQFLGGPLLLFIVAQSWCCVSVAALIVPMQLYVQVYIILTSPIVFSNSVQYFCNRYIVDKGGDLINNHSRQFEESEEKIFTRKGEERLPLNSTFFVGGFFMKEGKGVLPLTAIVVLSVSASRCVISAIANRCVALRYPPSINHQACPSSPFNIVVQALPPPLPTHNYGSPFDLQHGRPRSCSSEKSYSKEGAEI